MNDLETQVGQIFITSKKLSKSFISLFSEKLSETNSEIYFIMEVASNSGMPAPTGAYDKIAKSIENILKRNFRRENPNNFENSIAQINDFLAKTAEQGETSWVGHANACVSARHGENLYISTCGKTHAYLFRDNQFSDIADSGAKQNAVKLFENFAAGKIKKKDYLILSTSQLFNYLSIERLEQILGDLPINAACQTIVQLVKELADDTVSFGTLVLEFNEGAALESEQILKIAAFAGQKGPAKKAFSAMARAYSAAKKFAKHTALLSKDQRMPNINLPKINAALIKEQAKKYTDLQRIKNLPKAKKFFLAAMAVFILLFIANIAVTVYSRNKAQAHKALEQKISAIQSKIDGANTAYVFKDQQKAVSLTNEAAQELQQLPKNPAITAQENKLADEVQQLQNLIEHIQTANLSQLFSYNSKANRLILANNEIFAVDTGAEFFTPYNLDAKAAGSGFTVAMPSIKNIAAINGLFIAEDARGKLYEISPVTQTAKQENGALTANDLGMAFYGAPTRAYTMDKPAGQILSVSLSGGRDIPYFKTNMDLGKALDFAIGGPIYLLNSDSVQKFVAGRAEKFQSPGVSFSSGAKIYTAPNANFIYILDPQAKRIMVLDKQGNIIKQYELGQLKNPTDFAVDEPRQAIYILDSSNVWQMKLQ